MVGMSEELVTGSMKWNLIEPEDAIGIDLRSEKHISGPLNELGILCPWPWEVGEAAFDPSLVHRCSHCGQLATPGIEHPDYRDLVTEGEWQA